MFAADSVNENPTVIVSEDFFRAIAYHDRRRVIVVVETLESLTYALCRVSSVY